MDTAHPVWNSPAMHAARERRDAGAVIRLVRQAAGLTQTALGERCCCSGATISRLERGKSPIHDITMRQRIAAALAIPPEYLGLAAVSEVNWQHDSPGHGPVTRQPESVTVKVGQDVAGEDGEKRMRRRNLLAGLAGATAVGIVASRSPAVAQTLTGQLESLLVSGPDPSARALPLAELQTTLAQARAAFEACQYHDLAALLPHLIGSARATRDTVHGQLREGPAAALASAYALLSELAIKLNEDGIAWVAADRALTVARADCGVPTIAAASRSVAIAMRRQGHHDAATSLLTTTALSLDADSRRADPALLGIYGSLLCTAAYSSAQNGNRSRAAELIGEAEQTAIRIGHAPVGHPAFNPAMVTTYQIGIYTALGDTAKALDHASKIDARRLPTAERHARYCVDTARAWHRHGSVNRAYQALRAAEYRAPEEMRRPSVRTLISTMLYAPGVPPAGLRELAVRSGA